ncbi:MAG: amidase [Synergistaceae bacterium]|nr:amidase [Synergistaceae bacterium]
MQFSKLSKRTIIIVVVLFIVLFACLYFFKPFGGVTRTIRDLAYLSATEQIEKFKSGEISPVDVLKAQLEMIKEYNGTVASGKEEVPDCMKFNGKVNAISFENYEEALEQAKEAEKRYKEGDARPLEGITIAVKNDHAVKGWVVNAGSLLSKDAEPEKTDEPLIEKLREAGAIFVFQTTVPEFWVSGMTWSRLYGVTRNPWNENYTPGGSSGGSCAALAGGFCTFATGSDMGGSIRVPSSMCGVYGFRAPFGRVAQADITFYCTIGVQTRTIEDLILVQNIITGPSAKDLGALSPKLKYPTSYQDLKGVKIAVDYFDHWLVNGIDKEERKAMDKVVEALKQAGAEIVEVQLSWTSDTYNTFGKALFSSAIGAMLGKVVGNEDKVTPYVTRVFKEVEESFDVASAVHLDNAQQLTQTLHDEVQEKVFSQGCLALITPVLSTPFVPAEYNASQEKAALVNGIPLLGGDGEVFMTFPWNLLFSYPIVAVPAALTSNEVPVGVQVIGNVYQDLDAFRVAMGLSKVLPQLYEEDRFPTFTRK